MSYKIDLGSLVSTPWKNPYFEKKDCSQNEVNLISDSIIYQNDNSKIPNFTQYVTNHQQEELFGTNEYYIKTVTLSDLDSNFLATYKIANASTEEEIAMDDLDFYLANTTSFHPSDNEIFSKFLLPEINIFQSVNGDVPRLSIKEMYADDPEGYEKLKEEILGKIAINDARITREKPYLDVLEELETEIDDIEREINVLSDPANRAIIYDKGGAVTEQNKAINQANRDARAKLESKLATKKMQYRQTDVQFKLLDYLDIVETTEFQEFSQNYSYDYQGVDWETLSLVGWNPASYYGNVDGKNYTEQNGYKGQNPQNKIDPFAIVEFALDSAEHVSFDNVKRNVGVHIGEELFDFYTVMTDVEINMYHYLFATKGKSEADKYLELIRESLNQRLGNFQALEFLATLDVDDKGNIENNLSNLFGVSKEGLKDGIAQWAQGLDEKVKNSEKLSVLDYKKMMILYYLSEYSDYYDDVYSISLSLGNMLPSIVISTMVSIVATPAAGAFSGTIATVITKLPQLAGNMSMFLSVSGNARHDALVNGAAMSDAMMYGWLNGLSEVSLGYVLGGIPGLSNNSGKVLKSILGEAFEEGLQVPIDGFLREWILDEYVDWSQVPDEMVKSAVMGAITSGIMNGPTTIAKVTVGGRNVAITLADLTAFKEKNSELSTVEAFKQLYAEKTGKSKHTKTEVNEPDKIKTETLNVDEKMDRAKNKDTKETNIDGKQAVPIGDNGPVKPTIPSFTDLNGSTTPNIHVTVDSVMPYFKNRTNLESEVVEETTYEIDEELGVYDELNISEDLRTVFMEQRARFDSLKGTKIDNKGLTLDSNGKAVFAEGTLYHGTSFDVDKITSIAENGILTGQAYGISEDGETYYCADFYRISNEISINDYNASLPSAFDIARRTPFTNHNLSKDRIAFIVQPSAETTDLLSYDAYRDGTTNGDIAGEFVVDLPSENHSEASAVLYGVPSEAISGIVVGDNVAKSIEQIEFLKAQFPDCYIVSKNGDVIYNPSFNNSDTTIETLDDFVSATTIDPSFTSRNSIPAFDNPYIEVIDINAIQHTNNLLGLRGFDVNQTYDGYDYVIRPNGNITDVINNLNTDSKVLIEVMSLSEIDESIIDSIPDNVEIRIIGGYTADYMNTLKSPNQTQQRQQATYTKAELLLIMEQIENFERGINPNWSDVQKAQYTYKYLKQHITYVAEPGSINSRAKQFDGLMSLVAGESTCIGFAYTYKELLNIMGIKCEVISGQLNGVGQHGYNVVTIDGKTFLVDTVRESLNNREGTGFGVVNYQEYIPRGANAHLQEGINATNEDIKSINIENNVDVQQAVEKMESIIANFKDFSESDKTRAINVFKNLDPNLINRIVSSKTFSEENIAAIFNMRRGDVMVSSYKNKVVEFINNNDLIQTWLGFFGYLPGNSKNASKYNDSESQFNSFSNENSAKRNRLTREFYIESTEYLKENVYNKFGVTYDDLMSNDLNGVIEKLKTKGKTIKELAEFCNLTRNEDKVVSRIFNTENENNILEQRNQIKYGNPIGPDLNKIYDMIENSNKIKIPKTDDNIYYYIIQSSFRKDGILNTLLGIDE